MSDLRFSEAEQVTARAMLDDRRRLTHYQRAWRAYYGEHKKPLKIKPGKPDDNVIINYIRLAVNVKVAFLFGEPDREIKFSTDFAEGETTAQEVWLRKAWAANRKLTTLKKIGLNGAVCGNAYVKLMPPPPGWDYPRIVVLDPAIVTPTWDPNDIDRVVRWVIEYEGHDPATGKAKAWRQEIVPEGKAWRIIDQERRLDLMGSGIAGKWQTISSDIWPYTWAPVHQCQNLVDPNVFWGIADVEDDVIGLNDSINFIVSNIARILRYHAHPKTWGRGFRADELKIGADETITLEPPDAELHNLEMVSDLSSSIAFYQAIRKSLRETTTVPEVALGGIEDASRVSSLALKVLYGPLLIQIGEKRATYGEMLNELNSHLLELGTREAGVEVRSHWPFMLPEDPEQTARTMVLDQQLGASRESTLRQRGYDPAYEESQRQTEGDSLGVQLLAAFDRGQDDV